MSHFYSLAYLTIPGVTPPDQVHMAARAGYDFVSLRLNHIGVTGEPDINPASPQIIRDTRIALTATGLQCLDIELIRISRSTETPKFARAFEAGAELGARHVICSAWTDVRNDRGFIVEKFQEVCDLARPYGLTVNLEFPAFSRLASLDDCIEILELSQAGNQGLLVDTLYMHFNKTPLFALERVPGEWINFMHICDANDVAYTRDDMIQIAREGRLYPGDGAIDFSAIDFLFPNLPLAIELPNAARSLALGHQEHARRCLAAAKAVLGHEINKQRVQVGKAV